MTSTAFTRLFHQMLTTQRVTCAVAAAAAALLYLRHRRHKLPPPQTPQPELTADAAKLWRLLEVIEKEILPKTEVEVAAGNKVFGAAILDDSCGTVVAASASLPDGGAQDVGPKTRPGARQDKQVEEVIFYMQHSIVDGKVRPP